MSVYEWLLVLHVLSAFAFVASYVVLTTALVAGARALRDDVALALLRLAGPANVLAWVGATGTLLFGIWLTVEVDGYRLVDGWIAGALLLWLVTEEAIRREDLLFRKARRDALARRGDVSGVLRARQTLAIHAVGGVGMVGVLALMIFKPGAV